MKRIREVCTCLKVQKSKEYINSEHLQDAPEVDEPEVRPIDEQEERRQEELRRQEYLRHQEEQRRRRQAAQQLRMGGDLRNVHHSQLRGRSCFAKKGPYLTNYLTFP